MTSPLQQPAIAERLMGPLTAGQAQADRGGEPVLVSATLSIPALDAVALFATAKDETRVLWEQPSQGFSLTAVGAAQRLVGRGEGRYAQVSAAWQRLLASAVIEGGGWSSVASPICLGGFAFDPAREPPPHWRGYPDALLLVPRFTFVSRAGASWVTINAVASPGADANAIAERAAAELGRLLASDGTGPEEEPAVAARVRVEGDRPEGWRAAAAAVLDEIRRGGLEKLVLAREVRLRSPRPLDATAALRRLRSAYRDCTIFAFAWEGGCFLGATPERLIRRAGRTVWASCLAGSAPRGASDAEDRALAAALLADGKERHEHALVVRALAEALAPLCSRLSVPETPAVLALPNVQHLSTRVEGVLKEETDLLALVASLHPTPAVGGAPQEAALRLIRAYEPFQRGWYAGPVGWIDRRGDGEFVAAIRSALLREEEAWLYAGCGIVANSDPEQEYQESCLKLRPMLWALNGDQA